MTPTGSPSRLWRAGAVAICLGVLSPPAVSQSALSPAPKGIIHGMPAEGRAYEVLVPPLPADRLRQLPLVLYLHPSASPQLQRAKRDYWAILAPRRCLMVLPRSKSDKMWLTGEDKYVMDVLADVRTRYSVDAGRIILLGVSGGGQAALFLADRLPKRFRAVIVVSTNPVTIRGHRHEWFYPNRKVLKTCPYFVVNHITQGSALMCWRQVQAKLNPAGASISVLPVTGEAGEYQPPPKQLLPWLEAVLAGKHPAPLPDPQRAAVAKLLRRPAAALGGGLKAAKPAPAGERFTKGGEVFRLAATAPRGFERSEVEAEKDSAGSPVTQLRVEHGKWPIRIRCDARATDKPMAAVLSEEEEATVRRGMLYQVYHAGELALAGRSWRLRIGSITYPDRRRGWVSALFVHAAAPVKDDPKRWLTVMLTDETQQPDAGELAGHFKAVLATLTAGPGGK